MNYIVEENNDLVKYLTNKGLSKNKVKSLIKYKCIKVNNCLIEKLPYKLRINDNISINLKKEPVLINIIYEDNNYLVVDKENGLLSISTSTHNKNIEDTLYRRVRNYLNSKKEFAFIVNRIDKETSGIVIFVKNEQLKKRLQDNWNKIVKARKYIAVVSGKITKNGRIDNYLYEDKKTFSHSTTKGGKRAITNYKVLNYNNNYTLLDINIETGRKNQIRVHMTEMNHPIIGDKKYYSKTNPFKRLMLHHYEISLINPLNNKEITFKSNIPNEFYKLFRTRTFFCSFIPFSNS